jgi:hypothetical protein
MCAVHRPKHFSIIRLFLIFGNNKYRIRPAAIQEFVEDREKNMRLDLWSASDAADLIMGATF